MCEETEYSTHVGPLPHEKVRSHKGACLHATQNFYGHEEKGKCLYVGLHLCARSVRIEHEARTSCTIQVQYWCSFPAPLNGGRCPKGENFAGGVSRSACLSDRRERVARRVVTGEIFRPE